GSGCRALARGAARYRASRRVAIDPERIAARWIRLSRTRRLRRAARTRPRSRSLWLLSPRLMLPATGVGVAIDTLSLRPENATTWRFVMRALHPGGNHHAYRPARSCFRADPCNR